ncbi:hypothetical protein COY27_00230 [Candidatus Woesearchaeota archaeon CG_4_10_14_0_2_um_filter_33_13]|nr:MAG: hypothetical protein COY27_00230 [Candidatus Woesearchaeota archaeon CG_4_10_14_0_2_um_filter_33_13]
MFDQQVYRDAVELRNRERVEPLIETNAFRAGIYCVLSARETYGKLLKICRQLFVNNDLGLADAILEDVLLDNSVLEQILNQTMGRRLQQVIDFSSWWNQTGFYDRIKGGIDFSAEVELRNYLVGNSTKGGAPGLGPKSTSLYLNMLGCEQVVPVDIWVLRYLGVEVPNRGISLPDYHNYEMVLKEEAKKIGVSPAMMHKLIWCSTSDWKRRRTSQLDLFQTESHNFYKKI